ncbi:MAG: thioredoxin [Elusimicrobiales bacterium]|nr:thioredoxin [Elusimicrobiales bacterium]
MKAQLITDAEFDSKVLSGNVPAVVDFFADWCGPCKRMSPIVEELAAEFEGKANIFKMNVDDNPDTPAKFAISSIPAILFFKDGKEAGRFIGVNKKETFKQLLEKLIA